MDRQRSRPVKHGVYTSCPYCNGDHHLDDCSEFMNMTISERKKFFISKTICYGCATTDDHRIKDCSDRRDCKLCGGRHLTCLHFGSKLKHRQDEGLSNCTNICNLLDQDGPDHCMIVPVWVRHSDNPSHEVLQYAILDDQSNVGFISNNLCNKLSIDGPETDLMLTTMHNKSNIRSKKIKGVEVLDFHKKQIISLPACYSRSSIPANRSQIPKTEVVRQWPHLKRVADQLVPYNQEIEVSLLIGNNCPRAIRPRDVIAGGEDHPYAVKSALGWGVIGRVCKTPESREQGVCHKITTEGARNHSMFVLPRSAKEILTPERVLKALESDFQNEDSREQSLSVEDQRFLNILNTGIKKRDDGHYEMPLPFKKDKPSLPYNRQLADKRWNQLNARFRKNPRFLKDYQEFMADVISTCAERAPECYTPGKVNYVPHTGVYHPKKPEKIRVVFDCSAKFQGVSLNDHLLQGPDLTNGLLGVLCRFRREEVAFMADIKSMFHQFHVAEEDRDMLRFLWWEDGDASKRVVEYRMTVHLFGAASSPGCANFGLKRAADDGEESLGKEAADFIRNEFYVDDGLKSVSTPQEAVSLLKASQAICARAGLKLHKILSNKKAVLKAFPVEEWSKGIADLNLDADPLPLERALGVVWCVENDTLQFRIELRDQPLTRRGILSTICSIYDPIGFISPVTLCGKQILQELCRLKIDWDDVIPDEIRSRWVKWKSEVRKLEQMQVQRCYKPANFGKVESAELHHFSDASYDGYGQCSYLRLVNEKGDSSCSLVIAKSRVTPLRPFTIPRLELTAATISAKMSSFLRKELVYPRIQKYFWTDSKVVLGYISNEARRFHVFVANRVQLIRDNTNPKAWFYIDTKMNPADDASRGMTAGELVQNDRWLTGPDFLRGNGSFSPPEHEDKPPLSTNDPELKKVTTLATRSEEVHYIQSSRLQHISSWQRAIRVIALCRKFIHRINKRGCTSNRGLHVNRPIQRVNFTVDELQAAERVIIQNLQKEYLQDEWRLLKSHRVDRLNNRVNSRKVKVLKQSSNLQKLDPFLDDQDIMRVGGRISRADVSIETKHPVILPRHSHLSVLLIRHHHEKVNHMGRGMTHNQLRQSGYWVIGGSSAVSNVISRCVTCRKLRGSLQQQKMAELPKDRLDPVPPFTYCGVDYFGPFTIRERRSDLKRYGVIFTCMSSRAVHLESANSLSSSCFINCLRRFLSRRGPVRQIRSNQGITFIGARNELRGAFQEMNQDRVQEYLGVNGVDWIPFKLNTPHSSHMGGVWERQISTVRRALEPLLMSSGNQLDDESFRTFLTEVESIVNSRPLTTSNLCSSDAPEPLTPNHLLTMKPKVILPPPGKFQRADSYSRRWWRRVQYLSNEFWLRWRKEFLPTLQTREKWVKPRKNVEVGDIVILKEGDDNRCNWPLGRVVETIPSNDGCK
ncbi:uncharacterized protein LOC129269456 [Lytechinus pictus]|uniref:uncharacterized protein LOC129269456 n=1 Tax=Lytechinus pictus TaxID=7653 RepID=UPI0030B9FB0A